MPVGIARPVSGHLIMTTPTLIPPCFPLGFFRSGNVSAPVGWIAALFFGLELAPTDPGGPLGRFDSGDFLQDSGHALLDRLGGFGRDFLNEVPKFLVLRGRDLEILTALRG